MKRSVGDDQAPFAIRFTFPKGKKPYHIPLYGGTVYFCTDREEFTQVYNHMTATKCEDYTEGSLGIVSTPRGHNGEAAYVVGVFDGSLNTYVHELGHLAIDVLERAGCPITNEASEAFCYLIGHLAGEFQSAFVSSQTALLAEQAKEKAKHDRQKRKAKLERERLEEEDKAAEASVSAPTASKGKGVRRG